MTTILVQHKVTNYTEWKKTFDASAAMRTSQGELSAQIFRDAIDPNSITVMNKWNSLESAQKFVNSPELKLAMEKAGVAGVPTYYYLNEA